MASTWSWLSRRRHSEIVSKYLEHLDKILETVKHTQKLVQAYSRGDREELEKQYQNVFESERQADEIKRKIIDELSTEFFHPIDREELIRLVLTTDGVAAYSKLASRGLLLVLDRKIDQRIVEKLLQISEKVVESVELLKQAALELLKNPKNSLKLADQVEKLEEEVDDIRVDALKLVLEYCDQTSTSLCIIAKELVDALENASDKCEEAADVIRSIALLSI